MNNNAILDAGRSLITSIWKCVMLCNPFNEISIPQSAPGVPVSDSRVDCLAPAEKVLRVRGLREMTAANCNRFRQTVSAALDEQAEIEIDLSRTTSIDCAGLGALVAVRNLIRGRNGIVRLTNPNPSMQQLLNLMRAGQAFEIVNTLDVEPVGV